MHEQVLERLFKRFECYSDLAEMLDDDLLTEKIDAPKHKSLTEHLWCVVGARESYARAIEKGAWDGFGCSMQTYSALDFKGSLANSSLVAQTAIQSVSHWDDDRYDLLATLAEHEVMHEGQIIRHMYAIERELPASWVWA